ncbi:hypothetical protein CPB85DRAFT_1315049 [Mucidula mucida]|nr:hypothetical protein CPB85DRAFT_1315049 [Mucidula mucida]
METEKTQTRPTFWSYLGADVEPKAASGPLAAFYFMTGYLDVISFSAIYVWCGFQTGNCAQLGLALARLTEKNPDILPFPLSDRHALTSLLSFVVGGCIVGRLGDHIGTHKRIWLMFATMFQGLLTMAASLTIHASNQASIANGRGLGVWTHPLSFVTVAFMSASLGMQGTLAKRLNTQYSTTIVLSHVWVELASDPKLFDFKHRVGTRDHKLMAFLCLFSGAFVGRSLTKALGASGALGIGCGFRVLISLAWLFVPNKT